MRTELPTSNLTRKRKLAEYQAMHGDRAQKEPVTRGSIQESSQVQIKRRKVAEIEPAKTTGKKMPLDKSLGRGRTPGYQTEAPD